MQPGMVGLGRMGANMVRRLMRGEHACVVFDRSAAAVQALVQEHAVGAAALAEFVGGLARPPAIWLMVPAAAVDDSVAELLTLLDAGDAAAGRRPGGRVPREQGFVGDVSRACVPLGLGRSGRDAFAR